MSKETYYSKCAERNDGKGLYALDRILEDDDDGVTAQEHLTDEAIFVDGFTLCLALSVCECMCVYVCVRQKWCKGGLFGGENGAVESLQCVACVCFRARGVDSSQGRDSTLPARGASVHISLTFSSTILQCLSNACERAHNREGARAGRLGFAASVAGGSRLHG